jgi:uncharacterized membrane protein YkoI
MTKLIQLSVSLTTVLLSSALIAADNGTTSSSTTHSQNNRTSSQHQYASNPDSSKAKTMSFTQLPAPVQKTMRAEAGNLNLENIHSINADGQTRYCASFDKGNNLKGKVTVAEDGSLLQYQESDRLALISEVPKLNKTGMKLTDLPAPVQKKVKAEAASNEVGDISKDTQSGKTVYHVAFNNEGMHTDLVLDPDGKVLLRSDETALYAAPLQSSQSLTLKSAPQAVQNAVREHAGSSPTVTDIDKGTWNGQTAYRVMLEKNGTLRPLLISESGQILHAQGSEHSGATGAPPTSEKNQGKDNQSNSKASSRKNK